MDTARYCGARLLACAGLVRPGSAVADIGADHGHLVCYLVDSGRCPRAWATDLREKPLERARAHIRACGLEDRVETLLTDGLRGVPLDRVDDVVIAGMGGELIGEMLRASAEARDPRLRLVLQPMTRAHALRRTLYENGFSLLEERGVRDGEFLYAVMRAYYTGERQTPEELFCWTGLLPESDHPDSAAYLARVRDKLSKKAQGMRRSRRDRGEAERWARLAEETDKLLQGQ